MRTIAQSSVLAGLLVAATLGCQHSESSNWRPFGQPQLENQAANVYIPADRNLTASLRVGVVYNDSHLQIRYEYATDHPSWYHDYLVYQAGKWERLGRGAAGPESSGLQEDRISVMIDDGSVEGFATWGGYVTMHPGVASRSDEAPQETTKFILPSRRGARDADLWQRVRTDSEVDRLRDEGVFIHSWQWRAHRSNPIGYADPGFVLDARNSAEGRSMYATNWDDQAGQPRYMYDPQRTGAYALRQEALLARAYSQDDPYFLYDEYALPFNPERGWREGDVLPRRFLTQPSGSRASLRADGRWSDGAWRVRVTRQLEAPNPRDGKSLEHGESYNVSFAVHTGATQGRWHLVSLPLTLSLGAGGHIQAVYVQGDLDEAEAEWTDVPLFYTGQVYLSWLLDNGHPVHERYRAALEDPLDPRAVRRLARELAAHERDWLREQGIR